MIAAARRHAGPWPLILLGGLAAIALYAPGLRGVLAAWATPEYSHGPLIPLISAWLFAREVQVRPRPADPGGAALGYGVLALAIALGVLGWVAGVDDVSAYGLILWVFAVVLLALGSRRGLGHWAAIGHLVFMLPLPQVLWWKANLFLQGISAELGVALIAAAGIPVFIEGHVIDLGVWRLEVAEACSGLRYLFPILSFSVITAVLFNGPGWAKAAIVLSAAPIAVALNAARIGVIGLAVDAHGIEMAEGALHVLQGWVIFGGCLVLLYLLARGLWRVTGGDGPMLDLSGVDLRAAAQAFAAARPRDAALAGAAVTAAVALALVLVPAGRAAPPEREVFALWPATTAGWDGRSSRLPADIEAVLAADDYLDIALVPPGGGVPVNLFAAWYADQTGNSGLHSPEVCLPAGGWEIASLDRRRVGTDAQPVNRAVITRQGERRLVFYWFEQRGRQMTSVIAAKLSVLADGAVSGRTDGALVRLMTPIRADETEAMAEARLLRALEATAPQLSRHIPD